MKKRYAVLITLLLIPAAQSVQLEQIDGYRANMDIKTFESGKESHFVVTEPTLTRNYIHKFSTQQNWTKNPVGEIMTDMELTDDFLVFAKTMSSPRLLAFRRNGSRVLRKKPDLLYFPKDISVFEPENKTLFAITAKNDNLHRNYLRIYRENGKLFKEIRDRYLTPKTDDELHNLTENPTPEILVKKENEEYGYTFLELRDIDGKKIWQKRGYGSTDIQTEVIEDRRILLWWENKIEMLDKDGETLWKKKTGAEKVEPLIYNESIIYSNSTHLVYRDFHGEPFQVSGIEQRIEGLEKFPERNILVGKQGEKLSLFSLDGEKLGSKKMKGLIPEFEFANYSGLPGNELVVAHGDQLDVYSLDSGTSFEDITAPERYAFVGKNREILKLIALNKTVFIGQNPGNFEDEVRKKTVKVGSGLDQKSMANPNTELNVSGPKYYARDRKKQVYLAGLAAKNDAALTFDREAADRDFSNYTVKHLEEKFIEEYKPDHIAVADLKSDKGLLSAYMAVKQGILPIHFGKEFSYPEKDSVDVRETNKYNGVIKLEDDLAQAFEKIGRNTNTVWNGRYISLLEAPRKIYDDPVDKPFLSGPDGSWFSSDISYGDLDDDGYLEAGVGRYPENISTASKIYHRSLSRKDGKEALVASSYLSKSWPATLSTAGGGLRYGTAMENLFEKQGYSTTHLVEQRSDPESFLTQLVPSSIEDFMNHNKILERQLSNYISATKAVLFKDAVFIIKGLQFTDELLKIFYEFRWETAGFDYERGMDRLEEMEVPPGKTPAEVAEKSAAKVLYAVFWPERHPELNYTSLTENMEGKDIIYYRGKGTAERWWLPSKNRRADYRQVYNPEMIPELDSPIIWDNAHQSGSLYGKMREEFLEKGASSYLGFSAYNYPVFTSEIGNRYFRKGKTLGGSLRESLNSFRSKKELYTSHRTLQDSNVKDKVMNSLVMYGNPEMWKDPIGETRFELTRSCRKTSCVLNASLEPDYTVKSAGNQTVLQFNTTKYLKSYDAPITPLYSLKLEIPGDSIKGITVNNSFTNRSDIKIPNANPLIEGNRTGISITDYPFPRNSSRYQERDESLKFLQTGTKSFENVTSVLESSEITVRYSPKAVLDLRETDQELEAIVHSKSGFEAKLFYRINGSRKSRTVNVSEGKNIFSLEELPKGNLEVEAYLYSDRLLNKDFETFQTVKDLKFNIKGINISKEKPATFETIIYNPNSYNVSKEIKIEVGDGSRLGFIEKDERNIRLDSKETEKIRFEIVGSQEGNSSVKVGKGNYSFKVNPRKPDKATSTNSLWREQYKDEGKKINYEKRAVKKKIFLQRSIGQLSIEKSASGKIALIKTGEFKAKIFEKKDKTLKRVETKSKMGKIVEKSGKRVFSGSMKRKKFESYLSILKVEMKKFRFFF